MLKWGVAGSCLILTVIGINRQTQLFFSEVLPVLSQIAEIPLRSYLVPFLVSHCHCCVTSVPDSLMYGVLTYSELVFNFPRYTSLKAM
jgi:hypothetical protein